MSLSSDLYDIVFIGHMCFDEVIPYQETPHVGPGSAVLCGALAAASVGKNVAVVTQMAPRDQNILEPLRQNGIAFQVIPTAETTYMKVVYPSTDVDEREIYQLANAGAFSLANLPPLAAHWVHLAGVTDREFDLDFIHGLKEKGYCLSVDMQSFVRKVQPVSHLIAFQDVTAKKEIVRQMKMVKLDIVEAKVLTGTDDLEQAAMIIEAWGCPEVIITQAEGCWPEPMEKPTLRSSPIRPCLAGPGVATPPLRLIWPVAWITTWLNL